MKPRRSLLPAATAVIGLTLGLVGLSACGGSGSTATSTAPTTVAPTSTVASSADSSAGQRYLDIVGPANDTIRAQVTRIQALPNTATPAQLQDITDPWALAIEQTCDALEKASWPAAVQADMVKLIAAWRATAADVRKGPTLPASDWGSWAQTVQTDSVSASQLATTVRKGLGLAPTEASTATTN